MVKCDYHKYRAGNQFQLSKAAMKALLMAQRGVRINVPLRCINGYRCTDFKNELCALTRYQEIEQVQDRKK